MPALERDNHDHAREPFPASPEPEYRPDAKGPAPASVQNAVKLIWANVALNILSAVDGLIERFDIVKQERHVDVSYVKRY